METNQSQATETPVDVTDSQINSAVSSPARSEEKANIKALLSEARNTREMLMSFVSAVETGAFSGGQMMNVAKGMAFLDALLRQNNKHISDLQERVK